MGSGETGVVPSPPPARQGGDPKAPGLILAGRWHRMPIMHGLHAISGMRLHHVARAVRHLCLIRPPPALPRRAGGPRTILRRRPPPPMSLGRDLAVVRPPSPTSAARRVGTE